MLPFGKSYKPLVGLDISTSSVKAVELRPAGKGWRILRGAIEPLPPNTVRDGQIKQVEPVTQAITAVLRKANIKTKQAASSVSGSAVIIKRIQLANMSELDLEDQIAMEAEEYIPFDIEDVALDFQILQRTPTHMDVLLVACKNDLVGNYMEAIEGAGMEPRILDLDLFAIGNAYNQLLAPPPPKKARKGAKQPLSNVVALVNIGASLINITILVDGLPDFTRDHLFGGMLLTEDVQAHYGINHDEAERVKSGEAPQSDYQELLAEPFLDQLASQISQSLEFYQSSHAEHPVTQIQLSGGCARMAGISDYLTGKTGIPTGIAQPMDKLRPGKLAPPGSPLFEAGPQLMVALGLALRGGDL